MKEIKEDTSRSKDVPCCGLEESVLARILEWAVISYYRFLNCFLLQGVFPTHRSSLCLLCPLLWQADSLPLGHLGSPITIALLYSKELRSLNLPFSQELQQTQNDFLNEILTLVACPFSVLFNQNWKWPFILADVLLLIGWFNFHKRGLVFSHAWYLRTGPPQKFIRRSHPEITVRKSFKSSCKRDNSSEGLIL